MREESVVASSYDEVPYESRAIAETHPDFLASLASLHGIAFAPPEACRVLELGCADGGNLLAMAAALPGSSFVGVDGSLRQIRSGERLSAAAGISNTRLIASDFAALGDDLGEFDYVICHGVYSWMPPEAAADLLSLVRRRLAPRGVAYISFNTYPGWHFRQMAREMMRFHVRAIEDPAERIQQSRAVVELLARFAKEEKGTYRTRFASLSEILAAAPDHYVFHEFLEEDNHPLYLADFAGRAAAAGLHYLGSDQTTWEAFPPREVQEVLAPLRDPIVREQYLDFLSDRTFRRAVLCRSDAGAAAEPDPARVRDLFVSERGRPANPLADPSSDAPEEFVAGRESRITTARPLFKAVLLSLDAAAPRDLAFSDLGREARRLAGSAEDGASEEELEVFVCRSFIAELVRLAPRPSPCAWPVPERPRATAFARVQALESSRVTTLLHRTAELPDLDRFVLGLCDGENSASDVEAALASAVRSGEISMGGAERKPGTPGKPGAPDDSELRDRAAEAVGASLSRLARLGLFSAGNLPGKGN